MHANKKLSLIQEWARYFKNKQDWRKIRELAGTSFVETRPKTLEILDSFARKGLIDIQLISTRLLLEKYAKTSISEQEWKKLSTEIPKACSYYIKLQKVDENPIPSNLNLQYFFLENQMLKNLDLYHNKNIKSITKNPIKTNYNSLYLTRLKELELFDNRKKVARQRLPSINSWLESIEMFYYEAKLRILVEKLNRSTFNKKEIISEEQLEWVEQVPDSLLDVPQIKIYYLFFKMIKINSINLYRELKSELAKHEGKTLDIDFTFVLYFQLNAYCIQQLNRGLNEYHQHYIDNTKVLLEKNMLINLGIISATRFKNIIRSGMLSMNYEWTEEFYSNHIKYVPKKNESYIVKFSKALIFFYKKDFSQALQILSILPYPKDEFIKIDTYIYYLVTLVLQNNFEEAIRIRNNFREVIYKTNTTSKLLKQGANKTIYYCNKVMNLPPYEKKKSCTIIQTELKNELFFRRKDVLEFMLITIIN